MRIPVEPTFIFTIDHPIHKVPLAFWIDQNEINKHMERLLMKTKLKAKKTAVKKAAHKKVKPILQAARKSKVMTVKKPSSTKKK